MQSVNDRIFERQYKKLPQALQDKMWDRLSLLVADNLNPILNDHKLGYPFESFRSINITGDYRLVYKRIGQDTYYLRAVGTHNQLYGT